MLLSVIIPTYNRKKYLIESLDALARQSLPGDQYEVIVVDDGSIEEISEIKEMQFPYTLQYLRQENQGDAAARNFGARHSQTSLLVFLDDDMLVEDDYLATMIEAHERSEKLVVMGTTHLWLGDNSSKFQSIYGISGFGNANANPSFTQLCSNNMSVRRGDYFKIGMMENLGFPGSSIWCDVDFAYRAYKLGYEFYRTNMAIGYEKDYVAENLSNASHRGYKMAYRAVALFQKHPDLIGHLPMFQDKTPVEWRSDELRLILRKMVRRPASSRPIVFTMEQIVRKFEHHIPSPTWLRPLYRWIIGSYIFRGYREGLRDFK